MYVCSHVYFHKYVCMYVCMHVYVYVLRRYEFCTNEKLLHSMYVCTCMYAIMCAAPLDRAASDVAAADSLQRQCDPFYLTVGDVHLADHSSDHVCIYVCIYVCMYVYVCSQHLLDHFALVGCAGVVGQSRRLADPATPRNITHCKNVCMAALIRYTCVCMYVCVCVNLERKPDTAFEEEDDSCKCEGGIEPCSRRIH